MTALHTESDVVIPVRFTDLDLLGHVNHACVLTYCEEHRIRMLHALDEACPDEKSWAEACVVARVEADYLLPVNRDDGTVSVTLVGIGPDHTSRPMGPSQRRWWTARLVDGYDGGRQRG